MLPVGAVLVTLLGAAAPAVAEASECQLECREARRGCHSAGHAAYRSCRRTCDESAAEAGGRAHAVCREAEMGPRECARLVKDSVAAALGACRDDRRNARSLARRLCHEERQDCRQACVEGLDEVCVAACSTDLERCRDDLGVCAEGCAEEARTAAELCKLDAVVDGACVPETLRECARRVRREGTACAAACHEELSCHDAARDCLLACPPQAE